MRATNSLVSIIMPTYNHALFIGKAIKSVLNQTYHNYEVIVINNYSEDNTVDIVQGFKDDRIRLLNFANNGIIAASRNMGICESRGEWIAFLDSDDFWYADKLEKCSEYFDKYSLIYHALDIYTDNGRRGRVTTRKVKSPIVKDLLLGGNPIANSSVCVKKRCIDEVGMLCEDASLKAIEDFDLWIRVSKNTEDFKFINKSLGGYWVGSGNVSAQSLEKAIERKKELYKKHLDVLDGRCKVNARKRLNRELLGLHLYHAIKKEQSGLLDEATELVRKSLSSENVVLKIKSIVVFIRIKIKSHLKYILNMLK